jgi:nucleoside-diphosphate-sugar epimerase
VTGATGFVGRHVVPRLLASGHQVTAVSRDPVRVRRFSWFNAVRYLARDVHLQDEEVFRELAGHEAVIHLAWPGLPDYQGAFHQDQNLPADARFLRGLASAGVPQLLVTGTCL